MIRTLLDGVELTREEGTQTVIPLTDDHRDHYAELELS
jgi:hypothetical protein